MPLDLQAELGSGLGDLPGIVDLRSLPDAELETRAAELRNRMAQNRIIVNRALEERSYSDHPSAINRTRKIEGFAQELELVYDALRGALVDVEREQGRRVEVGLREREVRILDSTRWATWAAFIAAAGAVVAGLLSRGACGP